MNFGYSSAKREALPWQDMSSTLGVCDNGGSTTVATAAGSVSAGTIVAPRRNRALDWTLKFARKKPLGAIGAVIVILLLAMALLAPIIAPYDPIAQDATVRLRPPSAAHWAGTDQFGRDVFSRVIWGSQTSLQIGVLVTVVASTIAVSLGLVSAYAGGWVDYTIGRIVDTVQAIPFLILLIAIMVVLGPSLINVVFALSFRRSVTESRIIRSAALGLMGQVYIEAAKSLGAAPTWIMLRHLLPNIMPTLIVLASLGFGGVIISESSLSFLGYGVPPPTPTWGGMLANEGRSYMFSAPWMLIAPTLALGIVVFGINVFGDALRDVLDPRLRGS
ncbi:MAG: ABC transporter permease [Chloroflexi bacterium]|nr:MAG: ABC transporter permease [Chloroflexota bacterium]